MKYTADQLHKIAEVQTKFHWDVTFSGAPFANAEGLRMRAKTMGLPKSTHAKIDVVAHGYTFPGPGIVQRNGNITLTFFESVTADIVETMMKWHNDIYNWTQNDVTGIQGVAHAALFGEITMTLLDKQDKPKQIYELHRCIMTDMDQGGDLEAGDSPAAFEPVMTIEYAWFNWKKV